MLQDLGAGNSAVSNLPPNLILSVFFWVTGVQRQHPAAELVTTYCQPSLDYQAQAHTASSVLLVPPRSYHGQAGGLLDLVATPMDTGVATTPLSSRHGFSQQGLGLLPKRPSMLCFFYGEFLDEEHKGAPGSPQGEGCVSPVNWCCKGLPEPLPYLFLLPNWCPELGSSQAMLSWWQGAKVTQHSMIWRCCVLAAPLAASQPPCSTARIHVVPSLSS